METPDYNQPPGFGGTAQVSHMNDVFIQFETCFKVISFLWLFVYKQLDESELPFI